MELDINRLAACAQRIVLDQYRQLVAGPDIDLEADSKYNDELIRLSNLLSAEELLRYYQWVDQ